MHFIDQSCKGVPADSRQWLEKHHCKPFSAPSAHSQKIALGPHPQTHKLCILQKKNELLSCLRKTQQELSSWFFPKNWNSYKLWIITITINNNNVILFWDIIITMNLRISLKSSATNGRFAGARVVEDRPFTAQPRFVGFELGEAFLARCRRRRPECMEDLGLSINGGGLQHVGLWWDILLKWMLCGVPAYLHLWLERSWRRIWRKPLVLRTKRTRNRFHLF